MPYTIKKFNGQTLAIIEDGTVDTTSTNLNLPGKNYSGYGKALNESLVYLLENFASSNEPSRKINGQLWYDSTAKKIKIYDGTKFRSLGSIEYGEDAPANQVTGDMWFNTTTSQLFVWNGTAHKLIGPIQVGANTTQLVSKRLLDDGGNTRTVLQAAFGNTVIAIFSENEFVINSNQTPVEGFSQIYKGINLPSTTSFPNIQFAGVAKTSKSLLVNNVEISADQFVQNSSSATQTINSSVYVRVSPDTDSNGNFTNNRGLFVGSTQDLYLSSNSGVGYITNLTGDTLTFSVQNSGSTKKVIVAQSTNFAPSLDMDMNLGTATKRWNNVYGSNFYAVDNPAQNPNNAFFNGNLKGNVAGNVTGNVTGNLTGKVLAPNGVTVVLDNTGVTSAYVGKTTGDHYGNVYNLNADVAVQKAVDISTNPTTFRGNLLGNSTTATKVTFGGYEYPGMTASLNDNDYRRTVALRDADGRISAVEFDGTATKAASLVYNGIPRVASTSPQADTIVVRDGNGNINAGTISGTATDSQRLNGKIESVDRIANTIVLRDANSDVFANLFQGVAVQANYADLAEKYLADDEYEIGTVMTIGGEKEVTACKQGDRAIGVVSGHPAYLMNKDLEGGTAIALKGRVPVKVFGPIVKGQRLMAHNVGVAIRCPVTMYYDAFAMALESNSEEGVKIVECLVL